MQTSYTDTNIPIHNLDDFHSGGFPVQWSYHQAPHDDLSSAGLLQQGLSNPIPPIFQDPDNPSPSELRRRAIYENYRALVDTTADGGFGTFYGPVELIPGLEVQGVLSDSAISIVQIPEHFNPRVPKLLAAVASPSPPFLPFPSLLHIFPFLIVGFLYRWKCLHLKMFVVYKSIL